VGHGDGEGNSSRSVPAVGLVSHVGRSRPMGSDGGRRLGEGRRRVVMRTRGTNPLAADYPRRSAVAFSPDGEHCSRRHPGLPDLPVTLTTARTYSACEHTGRGSCGVVPADPGTESRRVVRHDRDRDGGTPGMDTADGREWCA